MTIPRDRDGEPTTDASPGTARPALPDHGELFFERLPEFDSFASITDADCYRPLPDEWSIGLADVVASNEAISQGRYKAVNVVGAAVVAAAGNAMPTLAFPFAFGGDGASLAVPRTRAKTMRDALARTAAWAGRELGLRLRVGIVPVERVRAAGWDVRVARYRVAPSVSYAVFSGGGLAWAEERLKRGDFAIPPTPDAPSPDLDGLRCDFATVRSTRGVMLSLIAVPTGDETVFARLVHDVLSVLDEGDAGAPTPWLTVDGTWSGGEIGRALSVAQEGAASRDPRSAAPDPGRPIRSPGNTDFRKFDDGLRMTIDCSPAVADALERLLGKAQAAGACRYGTHRQDAANLTCVLPSRGRQHAHFVDGASGGYATAAANLKAAARPA